MFSLLMITNNHIMNADMHKGSQFIILKHSYISYAHDWQLSVNRWTTELTDVTALDQIISHIWF